LAAAIFVAVPVLAAAPKRSVELVPWLGVRGGAELTSDDVPSAPAEASAAGSLGFGVLVGVRPDGWFET
jgi:hypothetical protein